MGLLTFEPSGLPKLELDEALLKDWPQHLVTDGDTVAGSVALGASSGSNTTCGDTGGYRSFHVYANTERSPTERE